MMPRATDRRGPPRRLGVLFLAPTLQGGGAERVLLTILRHLDRSKFDLTLAVLDGRDPAYLAELPADVEFIDLKCRRVRYSVPSILHLVWKRRPHVVLSTIGSLNLGVALMKPLFPRGVRLIARQTVVVSEILPFCKPPALWRLAYRVLLRLFDRIVCQSSDMRRDLVENLGIPAEKTILIHNPVDLARVRRLSGEPIPPAGDDEWSEHDGLIRLVAIGRLDHQKGFDLLIQAIALCNDPRLRLTILGEGPLRFELESVARDRGVASQVRLRGFQRNPYPFLRRAHALVLSSRFEGLPNVMLEALACGTPVIATPAAGGIREVLQGRPGCVIADEISAPGLASAIAGFPFEQIGRAHV